MVENGENGGWTRGKFAESDDGKTINHILFLSSENWKKSFIFVLLFSLYFYLFHFYLFHTSRDPYI